MALQDVAGIMHPMLSPLLARTYIMRGGDRMLRMGSREVKVAPRFRLVITTRISAPSLGHDPVPETLQNKARVRITCSMISMSRLHNYAHSLPPRPLHAQEPGVHLAGIPDVSAEVASQLAIINCAVTAAGLTAQLEGLIVHTEQPALAAQLTTFRARTHAEQHLQVSPYLLSQYRPACSA